MLFAPLPWVSSQPTSNIFSRRHTFIQAGDEFSRAEGLQRGAAAVSDPDDIIFASDLHLDM